MNSIILKIISFLHICFILFILLTPFIGNNYLLIIHLIVIPFVISHWYSNDNNCILTEIENKIRYKLYGITDHNNFFTYRLISPIYDFNKNFKTYSIFIYIIIIFLWVVTLFTLFIKLKNKKFLNLNDFLKQ